ncbi:competence protein CoiA [Sporosarcina sp. NPDC096371]|uniref:competence protein CoiA n=1 Tax=Sporosarcina sp. NPDC096371 TaxID=3364530 RepID=UPI00380F9804
MLVAKEKDGKLMVLTPKFTRDQLKTWRKSQLFFCLQCNSRVHLKVGDIVIPHFAHERDAACPTLFSEGESKEHLEGKQQLYLFLQKQKMCVELEPFLHVLSQRPDLLVTTMASSIAIEFQCSTIPISTIQSRSAGYRSVGVKPIWILHTPAKFTDYPQGVGLFYFSKFHESFFTHRPPEGYVLLTYNPQKERFHYFSNLVHVAGKRYIGIQRTLSLEKQVFPFARPKSPTKEEVARYASIYVAMRNDFLHSRISLNRRGINDPFLKMCYEVRVHPTNLPQWIGVPVRFSEAFREHDCEWQLRLVYYMRLKNIRFKDLSENEIHHYVSKLEYPTIGQEKACQAYRDFLVAAGIESFQNNSDLDLDESIVFNLFSARLLAKWYEN